MGGWGPGWGEKSKNQIAELGAITIDEPEPSHTGWWGGWGQQPATMTVEDIFTITTTDYEHRHHHHHSTETPSIM